jgi:hypothetical protein
MFIFCEFRIFCIDNARAIYRKIRYFLYFLIEEWFLLHFFRDTFNIKGNASAVKFHNGCSGETFSRFYKYILT